MDDLGFNKIAGAVLAVGLGVLVLTKLPGLVMGGGHNDHPDAFAYKVGAIETDTTDKDDVPLPFPQPDWVAAMDEARGAKVFKKCKACHNNEAGGRNGTGPNLYALVGQDIASKDGYKYSTALEGLAGEWTYEALDGYLTKPAVYAPGTKMAFNGLSKPADRAAVIEYLRVAAPTPEPRPEPKTVDAATMDADDAALKDMEDNAPDVIVEPDDMSMQQDTVDPQENDGDGVAEPEGDMDIVTKDQMDALKDAVEDNSPLPDADQKKMTKEKLEELD